MNKNIEKIKDLLSDRKDPILISILAPAYNEAEIIDRSVEEIYSYMHQFEELLQWELVIVNDGSKDNTATILDGLAEKKANLRVFHHRINMNLGSALRTGFKQCRGEYIMVLDIDLSYNTQHIEQLLAKAIEVDADIVVASPYMHGGKNTAVPWKRLLLSKTVNRFMRMTSSSGLHTFTGMVRIYKSSFLKKLNLKSKTYSINPEIIQKAEILRGRIIEIPAHLDWSFQKKSAGRTSSIRIFTGILAGLMTSFIFRPYVFFMTIGAILLLVSFYVIIWIFINTFKVYPDIVQTASNFENAFSLSVAQVFRERPYSFIVGSTVLIISLQFLSLGFISLQNKRYFDELFNLGSSILNNTKSDLEENDLKSF